MTARPSRRPIDAVPERSARGGPPAIGTRAPQALVILGRDRCVIEATDGIEHILGRPHDEIVGRRLDLIPYLGGRGRVESVWPDGSLHLLEYSAPAALSGAAQLVTLRDVTAEGPRAAGPAARDVMHATAAELHGRDVAALLPHAATCVCASLAVDLVGVFEYPSARRRLLLRAGSGWAPGAVGGASVGGARHSPVGYALAADAPVIIRDLRAAAFPARPSRLLYEHEVVSGIEVAIPGPARPWGVLGAYARRPREFAPDEMDFLCVVANSLSLALERADLEARLQAALEDAEEARRDRERAVTRARWSAERRTRAQITQLLHDEALQSLLAVRQHLALAAARPDRHDAVVRARDGVSRAIRELRGAVGALHPVALEGRRLREAIEAVVHDEARRGGFTVTVDLSLPDGRDCGALLLAVIRELTANVADHAAARAVRVSVRADGEDLVLEVRDDGVGVPPGRLDVALAEGHIGLASTARRVQALGGSLAVESGPTGGTAVRVVLPGGDAAGAEAEIVHLDYSASDRR